MKIAIGTDHRGTEIKIDIINNIKQLTFLDCSQNNYPTDDYPDFAFKVCNAVIKGDAAFGVLLCGTGIGMCIAANKVKGIRCALVHNTEEAELARLHNDANVIALSSSLSLETIENIIEKFVNTPHILEEKHDRRIKKVIDYENGEYNEL